MFNRNAEDDRYGSIAFLDGSVSAEPQRQTDRVRRRLSQPARRVAPADQAARVMTDFSWDKPVTVEQRLGVRLLNRNSRTLSLTEPGRTYFERCKIILDDLENAELELGSLGSAPRGTLRVTCPSWFTGHLFARLLAQYRARFPEIVVDVSFEDRFIDLVEDGCDLALRVTPRPESLPSALIARRVRSLPFLVAASREYIERNGAPESPQDLAKHDCIAVGAMDSWVFDGPNGRTEVAARIVQRFRAMAGVPHAVAAGTGLAPLPQTLFEEPAFKDVLVPRPDPILPSSAWRATL